MRSRIFFLMMVVLMIWSCEDPTTLPVSKVFNGNKLQTAFIDTFSVITSTVQLDTFLTGGSGTLLLGNYHDDRLGDVNSSTYFQISYSNTFLPDKQFLFDSAVLILPYNRSYIGDTTVPLKMNVYRLRNQMIMRKLPGTASNGDLKLSAFNTTDGFFSSSTIGRFPNPIITATVNFTPHRDSLAIKLPDSFGGNIFRLAQFDSGQLFSNPNNFVANYFYGLHINVDPSTGASVAGFKTSPKVRLYYKAYNGDYLTNTTIDFKLVNIGSQFNHIDFDRSTGSAEPALKNAQILKAVSTFDTDHEAYVQSGTGLVARLDFPGLKNFFSIYNGVVINAAYLEIYPLRGTYPPYNLPPSSLQLYSTDNSNLPLLSPSISSGTAGIQYDQEFGVNTVYRFNLFPYLFSQLKSNANFVVPVILAPPYANGTQGTSVQRLYFGDRFHSENKIKLKIYYSYPLN
ncbi:MAG: DUF4270 family protein [Cyclobacteriaceae bacterium]